MEPGRLVGPDRRGAFEDMGTAVVFLVSLVLLLAVGAVLFSGLALSAPSPGDISQLGQSAFGARRPAFSLSLTPEAVDASSDAGAGELHRVEAVARLEPTATATASPLPTPTATPVQARLVVGNTGGVGVYLRRTPNMNDRVVAWPDRTAMTVIGEDVDANGVHWKHVRDPRGNEGYIPAQYLLPAP